MGRRGRVTPSTNRGVALKYAQRIGCIVVRESGEAIVSHPNVQGRLRLNVRKKDTGHKLAALIAAVERGTFPGVPPGVPEKSVAADATQPPPIHVGPVASTGKPTLPHVKSAPKWIAPGSRAMGTKHSKELRETKLRLKNELLQEKARLGLSLGDFAELLGVHPKTVGVWSRDPMQTPGMPIHKLESSLVALKELKRVDVPPHEPQPPVIEPRATELTVRDGLVSFGAVLDVSDLSDEDLVALLGACNSEVLRRRQER